MAFIFDMDGTMVDNMMTHHRGWQMTLAKYGLDFTLEEVKATCHGKNVEIIERLFPGMSREESERISAEKEAWYRSIFLPELKLLPGLPEFLEAAHTAGIPMGIGTAAPKENVDFVLDQLRIRHYFRAVVHAEDVAKGKPEPEVFFKVADQLGVPYAQCLVFEDSPTGAKTALNAGMKAIILTTTHHPEEFDGIPSVLRCVSDFRRLTVDGLR
ncbi:MAG: HAD family phosphatase [Saprospiraceae bacterium]|nr:HAD family phosphatase [Saprospiraceae bacterium]